MQNDTAEDAEKRPMFSPATVNDTNGNSLTDEIADTILPGTDGAKRLPLMERLMAKRNVEGPAEKAAAEAEKVVTEAKKAAAEVEKATAEKAAAEAAAAQVAAEASLLAAFGPQ